jgi:hypothetical protein
MTSTSSLALSNKGLTHTETTTPNFQQQAIANARIIDQGISDIAKESRFTNEEVQEYYNRCGEMGRTRARFQKMRQELHLMFDYDDNF